MLRKYWFLLVVFSAFAMLSVLVRLTDWSFSVEENVEGAGPPNLITPFFQRTTQNQLAPPYNLPPIYYSGAKYRAPPPPAVATANCTVRFPTLFQLEFHNDWQVQRAPNGGPTLQLFSAHLDGRSQQIRIIGMIDAVKPLPPLHCQIWRGVKGVRPLLTPITEQWYVWYSSWGGYRKGVYQPYVFTCGARIQSSDDDGDVVGVSLVVGGVADKCQQQATNNLRVFRGGRTQNNSSVPRRRIGVCVKGLNFPRQDNSLRLVEWLELVRLLGANTVRLYQFDVHPNVQKVLNYYAPQNVDDDDDDDEVGAEEDVVVPWKVEVIPVGLAGITSGNAYIVEKYLREQLNGRRLQEVIPYNDCFYSLMGTGHDWIVLLDIDEVILSGNGTDWPGLIEWAESSSQSVDSFCARNVYFLDSFRHSHDWYTDIPAYMHMLQHVRRSATYTKPGEYVKCFHNASSVLTIHNHFPVKCLSGGKSCQHREFNVNWTQLQHYRADCVRDIRNCDQLRQNQVEDTRIWHFKWDLIRAVQQVVIELGLIP